MEKQEAVGNDLPEGTVKTYRRPVLFLHKSKAGKHLYAFNREEDGESVLGEGIGSILMDVAEVERLLTGSTVWIKVSVMPEDSTGDT